MWEWNNPDRLIYDKDVSEYLNNHEEVRNTLPKILGAILIDWET